MWTGPDGFEYTWAPSPTTVGEILVRFASPFLAQRVPTLTHPAHFFSLPPFVPLGPFWRSLMISDFDFQLYDPAGEIIALYRKVPPRRWDIGEVVTTDGELHFFSNAGSRTVTHPVSRNSPFIGALRTILTHFLER